MILDLRHPSLDALDAFAANDIDADSYDALRDHLSRCGSCQSRINTVRTLRSVAAEHPPIAMRAELRARVVQRVADGDRVIPSRPSTTRTPSRFASKVALAAAALIIAAVTLLSTGDRLDAVATAGVLTTRPQPGTSTIDIRYRPGAMLLGSPALVARVTPLATRQRGEPTPIVVPLERGTDGDFTGRATLPPSATMATFTGATQSGNHVDDNDARGWEAVLTDSAGRPRYDGLESQYLLHRGDNWERTFATAETMAVYYPDLPTAVHFSLSGRMQLAGPAGSDSVVATFRDRIASLNAKLANASLPEAQINAMVQLSSEARDTASTHHWRQRLYEEYPAGVSSLRQRVYAVFDSVKSPEARLAALEALWQPNSRSMQLMYDAFTTATDARATDAITRWGDRILGYGGGYEPMVAMAYLDIPSRREKGMQLLRDAVASASAGKQGLLVPLGAALLADGRIAAARDTLERAVALGWNADALVALGNAALAARDTAAAVGAYGRAAADPRSSDAKRDSLRRRVGVRANDARWTAALADGAATLRTVALDRAIRQAFDARVTVTSRNGKRQSLEELLGSKVAVVALVSRHCAPSLENLPALSRLAAAKVPLVVLTEETPSAAVEQAFAKRGYSGPVLFDDRGLAGRAMRQVATPTYLVIEGGNTIRFVLHRAEDVPMYLAALGG